MLLHAHTVYLLGKSDLSPSYRASLYPRKGERKKVEKEIKWGVRGEGCERASYRQIYIQAFSLPCSGEITSLSNGLQPGQWLQTLSMDYCLPLMPVRRQATFCAVSFCKAECFSLMLPLWVSQLYTKVLLGTPPGAGLGFRFTVLCSVQSRTQDFQDSWFHFVWVPETLVVYVYVVLSNTRSKKLLKLFYYFS